jgi:DNA-binding MarR family transcriptional regulator
MDSQTKLKRVVIKEELVILTGDHIKALILNQFLYWSERTKDYDKFIAEEKERFSPEDEDLNIDLTFGWIYKTAEDLIRELMLNISAVTARRHLTKLIKAGYIDQRHNPNHKWDRTLQYRPNIIAIQTDLEAMGYALDGYPLLMKDATFKMKVESNNLKDRISKNEGAIPETTAENITKSNSSAKISQSNGSGFDRADVAEKENLNRLADQIATLCQVDVNLASAKTRDGLKAVTLALYGKSISPADLKSFSNWWYNEYWAGKKGQPPTPAQVGDTWGQFETSKEKPQMTPNHTYAPNLSEAKRKRLAELIAKDQTK